MDKKSLLPFVYACILALAQQSYSVDHKQPAADFISLCQEEITFSKDGINSFITRVLNHPDYVTDFLPFNFSHLGQFLHHGKVKKLGTDYINSTLKLFNTKVKECRINAIGFSEFLTTLPELIEYQFHVEQSHRSPFENLKEMIKELLLTNFLTKFEFYQQQPHNFLDELSSDITKKVQEQHTLSENSLEQTRTMILRFLENSLNQLAWSPDDQEEIWTSFKTISEQLEDTAICCSIDNENLNDLYWSLVHSFCRFTNSMATYLSPQFYDAVKKDLEESKLFILNLEEQEDLMETKAQHLARAVALAEAKARMDQLITI